MFGNAYGPSKPACAQPLAKRSGQAVAGIGENGAEANAAVINRSISSSAISGLLRGRRNGSGMPALAIRGGSLVQLSGKNKRKPTAIGTSWRVSVSETSV